MFVHLRVKSDYSLLESTLKTEKIINLALQYKMPAIALTDSNKLSGALEFSIEAASRGVQPIIGCDLSIYNSFNSQVSKILLIAYNKQGFRNLIQLSSVASVRKNTFKDLKDCSAGILALSGDILLDAVCSGQNVKETLGTLLDIFNDNFFIELQRRGINKESKVERQLLEIANNNNIPIVATNEALFASREFFEAHEVLTCISSGEYIANKVHKINQEYYFKSQLEMIALFPDLKEAISNTVQIAKKCHFMPEGIAPELPSFKKIKNKEELVKEPEIPIILNKQTADLVHGSVENYTLVQSSFAGLKSRLKTEEIPETYIKRLRYELEIIINMHYAGYFLIVSDFIKWSKENNVPVGPGRGSAVGSLISWSLRITELDPIHYGLLFERFLNPDRVSMPDIDIDFCQEKRSMVIDYIHKKYKNVAHITTFGTLQPRAVLKDVGRVLQIGYNKVDGICKLIPMNPAHPLTFKEAIDLDQGLQNERDTDETIYKLLDISLKLEGLYRHSSTHAAGIVISSQDLRNLVPIYYDGESDIAITQYPMKYVEKAGLIKFDFLGLKTLTIIHQTISLIETEKIIIEDIPLDDAKTYKMLAQGNSIGVFQLESRFMQETLPKLCPDSINDIIALISLNRPGPLDNIPIYIARKHGNEAVEYPHPLLQNILQETFGVIIYQEQVMESARILANYSLAEADLLRRAMGKKIKQEMDVQKSNFIEGAQKNNVSKEQAEKIFETLEKFAGYGFNKSHGAAYAVISYQTAYLKANFPVQFFTAMLNLDINNTDKLALFISEAKKEGIEILPPSIKNPKVYFTIEGKKIIYAMAAVKSVGISAAEIIAKKKHTDIWDFAVHISDSTVNKKSVESLIKAGFFDEFICNRRQLISSIEKILKYKANDLQQSLFDSEPLLNEVDDFDTIAKLDNELEAFGFYLGEHPIGIYQKVLNLSEGSVAGVILTIKMRSTARGKFAIIELSTLQKIETIYFYNSDLIEEKSAILSEKTKVVVQYSNTNSRMIGKNIYALEQYIKGTFKSKMIIELNENAHESAIKQLKNSLEPKGRITIFIQIKLQDDYIRLLLPGKHSINLETFLQNRGIHKLYNM